MYCTQCGAQIEDDCAYCTTCGEKIIVSDNEKDAKTQSQKNSLSIRINKRTIITVVCIIVIIGLIAIISGIKKNSLGPVISKSGYFHDFSWDTNQIDISAKLVKEYKCDTFYNSLIDCLMATIPEFYGIKGSTSEILMFCDTNGNLDSVQVTVYNTSNSNIGIANELISSFSKVYGNSNTSTSKSLVPSVTWQTPNSTITLTNWGDYCYVMYEK